MRKVKAKFQPELDVRIRRVVLYEEVASEWQPNLFFLVLVQSEKERFGVLRLQGVGLLNISWVESVDLEDGDVVLPAPQKHEALVLMRESDVHHTLFMTNRCNSNCLMCSQPPTKVDDSWLVDEAIDAIIHLRQSPDVIGLTGGEPLLLKNGLRRVLDVIASYHPTTTVEVLTNGRLFSKAWAVPDVLEGLHMPVRWLIPLYGHADFVHDFVVQTPGAFDETLAGLLTLQEYKQEIQLRIVLIEPVLRILPELAQFIGRNLPFVREVALMGCEPIGFALANRDICEVNIAEWIPTLTQTSRVMLRHDICHLFMNIPLCALPSSLWPIAHQSISGWKNVYAAECDQCAVKKKCSGLFSWYEKGWMPAPLKKVEKVITTI